ncbi:MAG TPA: phosphoadenosine phosphosulfate reductase family protein [Flavobacteriales bacterium]|nr:phosphoadenosine phosphosulfate reductase family protein [Flavobacteriales bacterium]
MSNVKHVLGISGGKDSAALAIYMKDRYPSLDLTYYFTDTGKELDETYQLIERLEGYLGKPIAKLESEDARKSGQDPFDFYYKVFRGYLPSQQARWCTKFMKIHPFEAFVGDAPTLSYVGIRGDEDREGYISTKANIQAIFPFRRNIWSDGVIRMVLDNNKIDHVADLFMAELSGMKLDAVLQVLSKPVEHIVNDRMGNARRQTEKLNRLLEQGIIPFNRVVFSFLKETDMPVSQLINYALIENEEVLVKQDIFDLLVSSGVGVPGYYDPKEFKVDQQKGTYARSRSGCYFCFFQQKIEWVWLYEQHPGLFAKAMKYENEDEGFTWAQGESLKDLIHPRRIEQIKAEALAKGKDKSSNKLLSILQEDDERACLTCFL